VLLFTAGEGDPRLLQVKEARASALEAYAGRSKFENPGERVINGYRLMKPASDIFLEWTAGPRRDFFIRQLRDINQRPGVETFGRMEMDVHAGWCGRALALTHARAGHPGILAGYMGKSDSFDQAIASFGVAYADRTSTTTRRLLAR